MRWENVRIRWDKSVTHGITVTVWINHSPNRLENKGSQKVEKTSEKCYNSFMNAGRVWTLYAKVYDAINHNVPYVRMLDEIIGELNIEQSEKSTLVLDAGCGTGNIEIRIPASARHAQFMGVDTSSAMLDRARAKCGQDGRMRFQRTDLNKRLPFGDATFDRIVSINTLYAVGDPDYTLRELFRVLKSGGKFIVANPHDRSSFFGIMRGQYKELGFGRFVVEFARYLPSLLVIIFVNIFYLKNNANYWNESLTRAKLLATGFHDIALRPTYAGHDILATAIK